MVLEELRTVSTVVDIQQGTLRTFKHDEIATLTRAGRAGRNVNNRQKSGCRQQPAVSSELSGNPTASTQ